VIVLAEIPRTAQGKPLRALLQEIVARRLHDRGAARKGG